MLLIVDGEVWLIAEIVTIFWYLRILEQKRKAPDGHSTLPGREEQEALDYYD